MFWYIEDRIKKLFGIYVLKILGGGLTEISIQTKNFWLNKAYNLLNSIPEVRGHALLIGGFHRVSRAPGCAYRRMRQPPFPEEHCASERAPALR